MTHPNWRRFAQFQFTAETAAVLKALDIEVPPDGRPTSFAGPDGFMAARQDGPSGPQWLIWDKGHTRFTADIDEVRRVARLPAGTPSGDALRQWLTWWGWSAPARKPPADPNDQTKTII